MRPKYGAKRRLCASLTDESGLPCTCLDHLGGAHAEGTVNVGGPDVVAALPEGAAATSAPVRVTVFVRPASVKSAPGSRAAARPRTGTTACRTGAGTWSGLWAADVDAFHPARRPGPSSADVPLVMQYDGKGIVMRPEALRHATAKTAAAAPAAVTARCSGNTTARASSGPRGRGPPPPQNRRPPPAASSPPGSHQERNTDESEWPSSPAPATPSLSRAPPPTSFILRAALSPGRAAAARPPPANGRPRRSPATSPPSSPPGSTRPSAGILPMPAPGSPSSTGTP